MRRLDGVRPWKDQRDRPEAEVTAWEIDTAGTFDDEGVPLPRLKRKVEGSKARAIAHRRSLLVELTRAPERNPKPPKPLRRAAKATTAPRDKATLTLAEYIRDDYAKYSKNHHRLSTHTQRMRMLERNIIPVLGGLTIPEANTPRSVTLVREWLDAKKTNMKPASKSNALLALSSVLTMCADPDQAPDGVALIDRKVRIKLYTEDEAVDGQTVYAADGFRCGHARHKRLSDAVCRALWGTCKDDLDRVTVGLGLFCGCRISETSARVWSDVDFAQARLHIWSSICPHSAKVIQIKNKLAGWVPIPSALLEALRSLKKKAKSEYILEPRAPSLRGRARTKMGSPQTRKAIAWHYQAIGKRAKLERSWNYHALRHTFVSRLVDAGVKVHIVQRLARHKNIQTTYGYVSANEDELQKAGTMMDL